MLERIDDKRIFERVIGLLTYLIVGFIRLV